MRTRQETEDLEARIYALEAENAQLKKELCERGLDLSGGGRFTFVDGELALVFEDGDQWYIETEDIQKIIDFLDDIQRGLEE